MAIELELDGKASVVTGGSEGIGKVIAYKLAAEGVSVAICARREVVLQQAAQDIRARTGSMVLAVEADVTRSGLRPSSSRPSMPSDAWTSSSITWVPLRPILLKMPRTRSGKTTWI